MKFSRYILQRFALLSGDEGIRTPDPLLARQVLSQLSYTPEYSRVLRVIHSIRFFSFYPLIP